MSRDNENASTKLYKAMSDVIPRGNEQSAASEAEYGAVRALLDAGARLTPAEVAQIEANVRHYDDQASEEYEAGCSLLERCRHCKNML